MHLLPSSVGLLASENLHSRDIASAHTAANIRRDEAIAKAMANRYPQQLGFLICGALPTLKRIYYHYLLKIPRIRLIRSYRVKYILMLQMYRLTLAFSG